MNTLDTTREQLLAVNAFFDEQQALSDRLVYVDENTAEPDAARPNRNEPLAA
jgi:tRNA-dihydrouridine synthase B